MQFLTNLNLAKNELQNAVIQPLAVAPANGKLGQIYFNTGENALYQFNGATWVKVGVVYDQTSSTGAVVSGLNSSGTVTTTNVIDLTLTGYTPVEGGYVGAGDSLEDAIQAMDTAIKNAVAGGGEVNQNAWSYINVGANTISATSKTDTFKVAATGPVTVEANASTKTVTVGVTVDSSLNSTSTNPVQNKAVNAAIGEKYTKPSGGIPSSDMTTAVQTSLGKADSAVQPATLGSYVNKDGSTAMTGNLQMGSHKITGVADGTVSTDAATVGQMNNAISSAVGDYLPLEGGTMTGALNMGSNAINNIPNATTDNQPVARGQLPTTPVMTSFGLDYDGDEVTINKSYINVKTGATTSDDETIALANSTTAGLMSPDSVNALSDLSSRVEALEGTTVRLLYTTKNNPSAAEIEAFVRASGYTDPTKWSGIAVVVAGTYHIWHYYSNDSIGWRDDGVDTVSQWTNTTLGIIKGSQTDGKIYAEDDGTGSVNGWSALKNRVTNVENNKADSTTVAAIPVVKTATGTISTSSNSVNVSYTGTVIGTYIKDASNKEVITDVTIGASAVTFSTAQNPSTTLTATVIYI